jgi:hypothetical protein
MLRGGFYGLFEVFWCFPDEKEDECKRETIKAKRETRRKGLMIQIVEDLK